jgi:pyruvate/2-oxoglutarate/acetoin dehydrogenase E1 component
MWFDPSIDDAWTNGFHPGIAAAGYRPVRIDVEKYVSGIADQILTEIRRARFVVADYTGQRQGAYFEASFAEGPGADSISHIPE